MATSIYVAISSVTKTGQAVVGGGGATYSATFSTVSLALANATYGARNLSTLDQQQIYEIFKNVSPLADNFTIGTAWTTSPACNIIIRPAVGEGHLGKPNTGVLIQKSQDYGTLIVSNASKHVLISGFEMINSTSYSPGLIETSANSIIENIIGSCPNMNSGTARPAIMGYGLGTVIKNCYVYDTYEAFRDQAYNGSNTKFINCVATGGSIGYNISESSQGVFINCVATGQTISGFTKVASATWHSSCATNASQDATAPGTGSITGVVASNCFVNVSAYDVHLKAGSPLYNIGTNVSSHGVISDIDGQPWVAPYSIGFDQPGQFTVPLKLKAVPPATEIRVFKISDGSILEGIESSSTSEVTLNIPYSGTPFNIKIVLINIYYDYAEIIEELGSNGATFPLQLRKDRWYYNP